MLHQGIRKAELICVEEFPGIVPFNGLGQLQPSRLASLYDQRRPVVDAQFRFAETVDKADTPPQFWGDITLWAKINALADREPALVRIDGPTPRLPQWEGVADLKRFRITNLP